MVAVFLSPQANASLKRAPKYVNRAKRFVDYMLENATLIKSASAQF